MLQNDQEEADTKIFLCAAHAATLGKEKALITTVDSDVALYACYFESRIPISLYVSIGVKERRRVIDVNEIVSEIGEECCSALPALHAFTGNDYTSAFFGVGKGKAFKLLRESEEFKKTFEKFGDSFTFDTKLFAAVEKFVCTLYGAKEAIDTDYARYQKFIAGKKSPEPQKLPPTRDALLCHCKRVSFATAMVKKSLYPFGDVPDPDGYGWSMIDDKLEIQWILRDPAPPEVLQLISCGCKKSKCSSRTCMCVSHGLVCTDLCSCNDCENCSHQDDDDSSSSEESDQSDLDD